MTTPTTEYEERQQRIDASLTPAIVASIINEYHLKFLPLMISNAEMRCVMFVYASTAALLRRIAGGADKPIDVSVTTLHQARKDWPGKKTLMNCDSETSFCVVIGTALPFTVIGEKSDAILSQSFSCFKLPFQTATAVQMPRAPVAAPAVEENKKQELP